MRITFSAQMKSGKTSQSSLRLRFKFVQGTLESEVPAAGSSSASVP